MTEVTGQDHMTVPGRRRELLARIDEAADERRRLLLDDSTGRAGPANAGQATALRLIEQRRQAGRRRLREVAVFGALPAAAAGVVSEISGVVNEDAPVWRKSDGTAFIGRHHTVTAPAPGETPWGYTLRAVSPPPAVASMAQADLGDVVLDDPPSGGWPDGWTVTSTPRAAPATHERDVTIAQTEKPAPGTHRFALTARNAGGPSVLTLTIVVPVAAEGA